MREVESATEASSSAPANQVRVYRSPKIEVRQSPIAGRGVFAIADIAKDEVGAVKAGHLVTAQQLADITPLVGDLALQIQDDLYVSPSTPEEIEAMSIFINHSCALNVGFEGDVTYVAIREIRAGEELFHDYAMARSDRYSLNCLCGSALCRGEITGNDWKRPDLQERYGEYFSRCLVKKIRALKQEKRYSNRQGG